jgi:hypothetical protein
MDAGEEIYELGVRLFRIRKLIVPQSWRTPVEIFTNEEQWDRFLHKKSLFQVTSQPVGAFVWAGRMRFYPAPLITGEEIQILGYLLPSRVIDEGVDPEVDLTWDRCLEYGVMDQLIGGDWHTRYEDELGKQQQQNLREILAPHTIDNFSSDLGF